MANGKGPKMPGLPKIAGPKMPKAAAMPRAPRAPAMGLSGRAPNLGARAMRAPKMPTGRGIRP